MANAQAAQAMRDLDFDLRNEAIAASPDVIDLRPELFQRAKARAIAESYRSKFKPSPDRPPAA